MLFLDLDDFKPVNDTHGHATGDAVLRQVGARPGAAVRDTDLVARHAVTSSWSRSPTSHRARRVSSHGRRSIAVQRIDHELAIPYRLRVGELSLRASVGCGMYPSDADDAVSILRSADASMYEQKRSRSDRPIPLTRLA